jgi:polysaccharide export outer membrane protein
MPATGVRSRAYEFDKKQYPNTSAKMTNSNNLRSMRSVLSTCSILATLVLVFSCTTPNQFVYLNDLDRLRDTLLGPTRPFKETIIKPDDQLMINVTAYNPEDVQMFNTMLQGPSGQASGPSSGSQTNPMTGYIVDKNGMITLPYIGEFLAAGLTLREMEIFLGKQLERFVKQPVVKVRFLNHYVNVLGNVGAPGQVPMNIEQMTLFDLLARSGDLQMTAIRDNILVVREENGNRKSGRVSLLSKSVYDNPYFHLQHRDLVYVEPVQASYINRSERFTKVMGPLNAVAGLLALVLALFQFTR